MKTIKAFVKDESGGTAIEYAFIAMLIGLALVVTLTLVGVRLGPVFALIAAGLGL